MYNTKMCPVNRALEVMGGKWTPQILHELLYSENRRFGELRKALPGVSPKTLTERLRQLEDQGIVERTIYPEVPPRVEYRLTTHGHSLGKIIQAMLEWGMEQIEMDARTGQPAAAD
jgi:DNA-binding HxlR family transcriptional regulator